jgi:hypothetical protein
MELIDPNEKAKAPEPLEPISAERLAFYVKRGQRFYKDGMAFSEWYLKMTSVHGDKAIPHLRESWRIIKEKSSNNPRLGSKPEKTLKKPTFSFKKSLKIYRANIDWSSASMFIGLGSLAVTLLTNHRPWWLIFVVGFVIIALGFFAARGAYMQRSINRIVKFDTDFKAMKTERKKAANFLLGKSGQKVDVDEVLDFFDSPIGTLMLNGYLDENLVYDFFYEWIRGYWSACSTYIESQTDKTKWSNFEKLNEAVSRIHFHKIGSDKKIILTGTELREFLEGELE